MNKSIVAAVIIGIGIAISAGAFAMVGNDSSIELEVIEESVPTEPVQPEGRALTLEFHESVASSANP